MRLVNERMRREIYPWFLVRHCYDREAWEIARPDDAQLVFNRRTTLAGNYAHLAFAALDLDFPAAMTQRLLAAALNARLEAARSLPSWTESMATLDSLAEAGICRDPRAANFWADFWAQGREGKSDGSPKLCFMPQYWSLANAMIAHADGRQQTISAAVDRLGAMKPLKKLGKKGEPWFEAMRALAIDALAGPGANFTDLLAAAGAAGERFWDTADGVMLEAVFSRWCLGFAGVARDRGWPPQDVDPHPNIPLALLRLPPLDVNQVGLPYPDENLKDAIQKQLEQLDPERARPTNST